MPPWFSDHLPILRFRRPRSSPAGSWDGANLIHQFQGNSIEHQLDSTDRHVGDRASDYLNAQPSQVSQPVAPSDFVPPNAVRTPESHGSDVEQPTFPASSSNYTDSVQAQQRLAPPPPPAVPSQQFLNYDPLNYSSQPQHRSPGMFYKASNFNVLGTFVDASTINYSNTSSNQFMDKLLEKTILGAEFDSSARDPPPRCHPGTRLDILERCLHFVRTCEGKRKTRWVVGAAGVGKSAIMQSVVESPKLALSSRASVFFSINGRDDGTKAVVTISYQLAVNSELYRQFIEREITRDPSLLRSSMEKQFLKLIIDPFIHNPQLNPASRILIVVDGLDECKNPDTQLELLRLISGLCIKYPSSPFVWLIASRPEQHITSFFSQSDVVSAYDKEEIVVDSDKAREDVEQFLRSKLTEIKKKASDSVDPRWPEERDIWKLANAAGGLFAYAQTAIRYIDNSSVGSPALQLSDVLNVIDDRPITDVLPDDHPMALLDALYARILSKVPLKVMANTRKLLLAFAFDWVGISGPRSFVSLCNWLGMTPDDAYAALNHLRSVLGVPRRDEAYNNKLEFFHKSFMDYLFDFRRSEFSHDFKHDAQQLMAQCAFRILNEALDGVDFCDVDYKLVIGILRRGPGTGDNISITWPVDEDVGGTGNAMKFEMYAFAVNQLVAGIQRGDPAFQTKFCVRFLSTRFEKHHVFIFGLLRALVFDGSRRQEFILHGILKHVPLKTFDVSTLEFNEVRLQFRRPATTATNLSDPWYSSCRHKRGQWREGDDEEWVTYFNRYICYSCQEQLRRQLKEWKTRSPDHVVPIFFTSTGVCGVEFRFVDPDDGFSEWTYLFEVNLPLEERKKYGSDV